LPAVATITVAELTIPWPDPSTRLSENGWRERLTALALECEALIGRDVGMQHQARLAMQFAGLGWPGWSVEIIAASCRASVLLGQPVVVAPPLPEQIEELHRKLYNAAIDTEVRAVEAPRPFIQLPARNPTPGGPESVPTGPTTPEPVAASAPVAAASPRTAAAAPAGWLTTPQVAAAIGLSESSLQRRRRTMGLVEGQHFQRSGRAIVWASSAIDALRLPEKPQVDRKEAARVRAREWRAKRKAARLEQEDDERQRQAEADLARLLPALV
jgi:hypothetical protein